MNRRCFSIACLMTLWAVTVSASLFATDRPLLIVSCSGDGRLESYTIDDAGKFKRASNNNLAAGPATSRFDAIGRHFYVGTSDPPGIASFRVEGTQLVPLETVAVPSKPSYLWITSNGQYLLASYYSTGQVTVHRIVGEGHLSDQPIQQLQLDPSAHCITTNPGGQFVFVPHTKSSRISQLRIDKKSGRLSANDPAILQRSPAVGPRHLGFHPHEDVAFGSNEQGRSISVYRLNANSGLLREIQTLPSEPEGFDAAKASTSHVEVHPSGRFVYIANRGHDSITAFRFDSDSGQLTLIHRVPAATFPRSFSLSPGGRFLVVAGQKSNSLVAYQIDQNGRLSKTDEIVCGKTPWWVSFSTTAGLASTAPATAIDYSQRDRSLTLGQGTMSGEVTDQSALLQTRLTSGNQLDQDGNLPGVGGFVRFEWSTQEDFGKSKWSDIREATATSDFIVRSQLRALKPNTKYFFRAHFGPDAENLNPGPSCSFGTLPGSKVNREVNFIVGSCMNYIKFMHGRAGKASGPLTATAEDKRLGFPAFATMTRLQPEFFVGTGDIVYYDNPFRVAKTVPELRECWHEQFRFPRMVEFFRNVPTYWSKDDHDFRYNDSDNASDRIPLPKTGIEVFREQLPIAPDDDVDSPNYRTHRVSKHLQIWLTEGRDHRSPNKSPDGPQKTMWGAKQRDWLMSTLATSDATWKMIISPTPMVGPDDGYKSDNHANLLGFRNEADAFFDWLKQQGIQNLVLVCGDRHWQYHSIHPSGIHEFAVGALNDENSRMGVAPGDKVGSDPEGKVRQLFTSPEPGGGFLQVKAGESLQMTHYSDDGQVLYQVTIP